MASFPSYSHLKLTAPGIGMTNGQMENLYLIYNEAVINKNIKPLANHHTYPRETYFYLKENSGYEGKIIAAFMIAIIDYANSRQTEKWKNPIYREKVEGKREDTVIDFFTKPIDVVSKAVGGGVKNITDPLTKPIIIASVVIGSGALIYFAIKAGLLKGAMKSFKKK